MKNRIVSHNTHVYSIEVIAMVSSSLALPTLFTPLAFLLLLAPFGGARCNNERRQ